MTTLNDYLTTAPGRCPGCGFHVKSQGCRCVAGEWATFTDALRRARRSDGTVHQADMRPLIRGRIEPKHIGLLWKRAKRDGLVVEVKHERSDDVLGKNAGRLEPVYQLGRAA